MGVPKFFRYTSERYPCLNELVKQYQIPDFDNMYLDMNGIIHNCSHPDDSDPHFRISEEKIFQDIFHYISILFQIIKPKKLFFMAIDGVAPRAKMNQQRGRRFRSAREAEKLEEEAKAKGEVLPTEKRFDSNCITPGTVFMSRLHQQLRYFVKQKISTDPLWSKVKVILSGHETPGEGEHKIMDYIRWARAAADYDPNTRHCLYGLDADLIMLGVCTHEPHFALLREEVKFGRSTQRATSPEETNFYLLHLSLLREYLEQEFISIKDSLPFEYDLEKIVDDWVLMGFLVGNDFIPHLPHMHIGNDALPLLYNTYMKVLPTLDGYINEAGDLNLERFEIFMQELAKIDKEKFQDVYADLKYFEAKTGRRPNAQERKEYKPNNDETFNVDVDDIKNNKPDDELQALINATQDMFMDDVDDLEEYEETSDEEDNMEKEFLLHKKDYYMNKLDYSKVTNEVLADQAEGYVRAIQWNLFYYYKGCPSWCWYYPHHYAPYISDIKGFKDLKIEFELGEPFKPFEQLLAVLPAASKQLLPAPFHDLMTDEDSPIVHYYPVHFETDLNGKRNDWEAVVLIPFIDEANLLSAMAPCYQRLTDEELQRNTHGPMLMYDWTANSQGVALAPEYFPAIPDCHALETRIWRQELEVSPERLRRGALPNAHTDKIFPGFPTMKHLEYTTSLRKGRVKVFDQPSRNESMIVQLKQKPQPALEAAARDLLGRVVWVGWPHLTRAKVISVSNEKMRLHHVDKQNNNVSDAPSYSSEANLGNLHKQWISERSTIIEHNMNRLGIDLGEVNIIVHAVNLKGHKYIIQDNVSMVLSPEWCSVACGYARQAVLRDAPHVQHETVRYRSLGDAYPPGERVFLLTQGQYYGCRATVVDSEAIRSGRMKVCVSVSPQPVPAPAAAAAPYRSAHHAAAQCGISSQLLSRVTGSVLVVLGERHNLPTEQLSKINIGLNLKFNKKNLEVCGFTRRSGGVGGAGGGAGAWQYSGRCVALVQAYAARYPQLFQRLAVRNDSDIFFESDLWPDEVGEKKPQEVQSWLKSQPYATAGRRECGSLALEPEELRALWDGLRPQLQALKAQESTVTLQVKWNLLYKAPEEEEEEKASLTLALEPEELRALWDGLRPQLQALKAQESTVTLQVKWNLLYKAELHEGNLQPDPSADFKLYDRVVCVSPNIAVPAGSTGTVTATLAPPAANTCRLSDKLNAEHTYQVMFDEPFAGGMCEQLFDETRFYRMSGCHMLNLSYGRKLRTSARAAAAPTLLRRDDGHHSAFASYSPPTAENKTQQEVRPITNNVVNNGQDNVNNATHLLRSLLKISEDEEATKKKNNKSPADSNWRNKQPPQPPPQHPPPHRMQAPPNWRKEMGGAPPQLFPSEWTNTTFKGGPNGGVLPSGGPGAAHVPFPQFPGFAPGPQPPQPPRPVFPPHLPPVAANITLGPSWVQGQCQKPAGGAGRAAATPFVPLQVQTSQRRIQNSTTGAPPRHEAPPAAPPPPPAAAVREQKQASTTRPQKKKKPRIAANLPFQIE